MVLRGRLRKPDVARIARELSAFERPRNSIAVERTSLDSAIRIRI